MIERQIRFLREAGVDDVTVVTGYKADKLTYLQDKHGVTLVHNDKYDVYNNIYSLYLVRHLLKDTYILEGDVFLARNVFLDPVSESGYFSGRKSGFVGEWLLHFDESRGLTGISIGDGEGYIMSGISFWAASESEKVRRLVERRVGSPGFETLFWDDLIKDNLDTFHLRLHPMDGEDWFEIDTVADLARVERRLREQSGSGREVLSAEAGLG